MQDKKAAPITYPFQLSMRTVFVRIVCPLVLMILTFLLVMGMNFLLLKPMYKAQSGVLDISKWSAKTHENISLAGDWAIFWDEFVEFSSLAQRLDGYGNFISLPGVWNDHSYENNRLPAQGKASLSLTVQLPSSGEYVLKIPALYSSYRLWLNGELKVANPSLDDKFRQLNDVSKARLIPFNTEGQQLQILLHVANYRHRVGGIWENLSISPNRGATGSASAALKQDVAAFTVLVMLALALLALAWRGQRRAYVFLALWAVLMALRAATIEERLLFVVLDIVDWEVQQRLEYLFLYSSIPFLTLYLGHQFPRYFPVWLHWSMCALVGALILLVLFSSAAVYSHTIIIFQLFVLLYAFAWLGGVSNYVLEQGTEAWLLLCGSLVLIAAAMNDIVLANVLFADSLLNGVNITHYGALGFIFFVGLLHLKQPEYRHPAQNFSPDTQVLASDPVQSAIQAYRQTQTLEDKSRLCLEACKWAMYVWEKNGYSKLDLAEQSKLWKVTNDEGSLKTRTLDKYLRADTFPKRPRYHTVIKTLNFVAQQEATAQAHANLLVEASVLLAQ